MAEVVHPKSRLELVDLLKEMSAETFTSRHVLDRVPHVFVDRGEYVEWKSDLAKALSVDPMSIVVVGSAGLGYSLAPSKAFRAFRPESDIDVAVISNHHFEIAWRSLRELGPLDLLRKRSVEYRLVDYHRTQLLFDGSIATDRMLGSLDFGPAWVAALARAEQERPTFGHTVKVRIYRDFESLRMYQLRGVRSAMALIARSAVENGGEIEVESDSMVLSDPEEV